MQRQSSQVIFDPSITLGALINSLALLVGFAIAFTKIGGRIDLLAHRVKSVEVVLTDFKVFDKRLTTVEERLTSAQRDVSDLRRGEGFVTGRRTVDGEYK